MTIRPIVKLGDPVLRKVAAPVDPADIGTENLRALISDLIDTNRGAGGVGLAAPQIGVSQRVVVVEIPQANERTSQTYGDNLGRMQRKELPLLVMINPRLIDESIHNSLFYEWCLSADAYAGLVSRPTYISVTFVDEAGANQCRSFDGWAARVVRHEIDHLDGNICLDLALPRSLVSVESWRNCWARRDPSDACCELGVDRGLFDMVEGGRG